MRESSRTAAGGATWQRTPRQQDAGLVWAKYGLNPAGFLRDKIAPAVSISSSRAYRFRSALVELGSLYRAFGRFLNGRADLLPDTHLVELRQISIQPLEVPHAEFVNVTFPGRLREAVPIGATACTNVYRCSYQGRPVVVEILTHAPSRDQNWKEFCAGIRLLRNAAESAVARPSVLEDFWQWLALCADISKRRNILKNLQALPSGSISRFPRIIPELQSDSALAYEWMEGEPFQEEKSQERMQRRLRAVVESALEQSLFLSVVPAELDPGQILVTEGGEAVALRVIPPMSAVPTEWNHELLQYTASWIAGETVRAIRMLARMVRGLALVSAEQRLWRELSALQPELKIRTITPPSVAALENCWKALTKTGLKAPLFLQLFHREFVILGQYNGEHASDVDLISESVWPVLGRIVRFRLTELLKTEKIREWSLSSAFLLFGTARQMALTLEQAREDDLSVVLESERSTTRQRMLNLRVGSLLMVSLTLAILIGALQIAAHLSKPLYQAAASFVIVLSGMLLFLLVSRVR